MPRISIFALLAIPVTLACQTTQTRTQPPKGHVEMTLTCFPDGTLGFDLAPWTVSLPDSNAAFVITSDAKSSVDATITTQNPLYPFGGKQFTARHGAALVMKPVAGTPPATYKYSITVVCPSPTGPKPTVIDPDMIIPWKIAAS
jgi:hypothetical protein